MPETNVLSQAIKDQLSQINTLIKNYKFAKIAGRVVLLKAETCEDQGEADAVNGWNCVPNLEICCVKGSHYDLFSPTYLHGTATALLQVISTPSYLAKNTTLRTNSQKITTNQRHSLFQSSWVEKTDQYKLHERQESTKKL